jgi:cytochrome b
MSEKASDTKPGILVWDLPTRILHWSLVILVVTSVLTGLGWSGLRNEMEWHERSGIGIMVLLFFRIFWGFIGGRHARFSDFVKGPKAVLSYAKGLFTGVNRHWRGHNPMGALSVVAMLGLLAAQVGTGLFANDDSSVEGPLFNLVGKELSDAITSWHFLIIDGIYVLVGLHVAAIIAYRIMGERLIPAMLHGCKDEDDYEDSPARAPVKGNLLIAAAILATSIGLAVFVLELG